MEYTPSQNIIDTYNALIDAWAVYDQFCENMPKKAPTYPLEIIKLEVMVFPMKEKIRRLQSDYNSMLVKEHSIYLGSMAG